jgi:aryl-alcohol dehydrogenase-like predicted oxidoreductase
MVATSKDLPRIGLGMAALGRPGYINLNRSAILGVGDRSIDKMQTQSNLVMDTLFALEETPWLDCARSYGLSEKFVGDYLRANKIKPDHVYVSSKWGYTYVADFRISLEAGSPHEIKDHSVENFLKQMNESLMHLGEYIDLYQIHSATLDSGILSDTKAHEALAHCKKERNWAIGLSVSSPLQHEIIREAMKIKINNVPLFDSVQCTFNVLEQGPAEALQEAHDSGMDIIIKEGLANGRVLHHPKVVDFASKLSCTPDQLALGCILAQPFQPRVLSGAVTPEQLESNLKATTVAEQLKRDPELLQHIMGSCKMKSEEYWAERSALPWN